MRLAGYACQYTSNYINLGKCLRDNATDFET